MLGDWAEHLGQPGLGIDAIELGRFDERISDGRSLAAALRTHEQRLLRRQLDHQYQYEKHPDFDNPDASTHCTFKQPN